jgi:cytochrome c-type biogenesis protein CcmH
LLVSFLAGALVGIAATLGVSALRRGNLKLSLGPARTRYAMGAAFVAVFAVAAVIIYTAIGARHARTSQPLQAPMAQAPAAGGGAMPSGGGGKSMEAEVAKLEQRLTRDGGSDEDWNLLAKAYEFLGRPDDARRARKHLANPGAAVSALSAGAIVAAASATETRGAAPESAAPAPAAPPGVSVSDLRQRVKANPRDAQGWLALANAYRTQHDDAAARDAYIKVVALNAMTAQSWADYADVLASLGGGSLAGAAPGDAIDKALALDPSNLKALWLKGSQQHEERHFADALTWWKRLRSALPPDSPDVRIIDGNIAEDSSLGGLSPASPSAAAAASGAPAGQVSGTVSLDSRFAGRVQGDATLFIYAKAADSPGPPLAVLRTTANTWPVSFHLDDSMAMIPSRKLSQFDKIVVEARISRSGQATPSSGDLYVTSPVMHPDPGKKLALVINRVIG